LAVPFLLLGLVSALTAIWSLRRHSPPDVIALLCLSFSLFFGFIPAALFLLGPPPGAEYRPWSFLAPRDVELIFVLACLTWFGLLVGWRVARSVPLPVLSSEPQPVDREVYIRLSLGLAWFLLVAGFLATLVYMRAYGGPIRAMAVAAAIRSGIMTTVNPWSFLRAVGDLGIFASFIFLGAWVAGIRSIAVKLGTVISIAFSLYMYLFLGGRLSLGIYLLIVLLGVGLASGRSLGRYWLVGGIALVAFSMFGHALIYAGRAFMLQQWAGIPISQPVRIVPSLASPIDFLLLEWTFPLASVQMALDQIGSGGVGYRYGRDLVYGVLSLIPSRIMPLPFVTIETMHTGLINPGSRGAIPVDVVTYGVYSFGANGVFLMGTAAGFTARLAQRYVQLIPVRELQIVLQVVVAFFMGKHLIYFDPAGTINTTAYIAFGIFLLLGISHLATHRSQVPTG
jgi:hypothetical protein